MARYWPFAILVLLTAAVSSVPAGGEKGKDGETIDLKVEDKLTNDDPRDKQTNAPRKIHMVKMKSGNVYTIDMASKQLDSYLRLEDQNGNSLAEDDDSGGNLDARIVFSCNKDGDYKIICTALGQGIGDFTLIVKHKLNTAKNSTAHQSLIGKPAPDFKADFAVNGPAVKLSDLKGKVVLVEFCDLRIDACVAAIDRLRDWNDKLSADGVEIVGVTFYNSELGQNLGLDKESGRFKRIDTASKQSDQSALTDFAAHYKLQHRLMALTKDEALKAFDAYAVNGVPQSVLIDRQGKVRAVWVGDEKNAGLLKKEVWKVLAE